MKKISEGLLQDIHHFLNRAQNLLIAQDQPALVTHREEATKLIARLGTGWIGDIVAARKKYGVEVK